MKRRVPLLFLLSSSLLHAQLLPVSPRWEVIPVTANPSAMKDSPWLNLKSFNQQLHLLYAQGSTLKYAFSSNSGTTWKAEVIGTMAPCEASLALDLCGKPHILYATNISGTGPSAIIHLFKEGGAWHRDTIENNRNNEKIAFGPSLEIQVDDAGTIHCVYEVVDQRPDKPDEGWGYAYRDSASWILEHEELSGIVSVSLVTDLEGNPRVMASDNSGSGHYFSSKDQGNTWSHQVLPVSFNGSCDLALSRGCRPIISYTPRCDTCGSGSGSTGGNGSGTTQPYTFLRKVCTFKWARQEIETMVKDNTSVTGKTEALADRDGRLSFVFYSHSGSAFGKTTLVYTGSTDEGKTNIQVTIPNAFLSTHCGGGHPGIAFTNDHLVIAFMGDPDRPFIARTAVRSTPPFLGNDGCRPPSKKTVHCGCGGECPPGEDDTDGGGGGDGYGYGGGGYGGGSSYSPPSGNYSAGYTPPPPVIPFDNPPPGELKGRGITDQGQFEVDAEELVVKVWDDHFIDNDIITLFLNDTVLVDNFTLPGKVTEFTVKLDKRHKNFYLMLYADDQGSMPPCTVAIILRANGQEKHLHLKSDTKNCGTLKIVRKEI